MKTMMPLLLIILFVISGPCFGGDKMNLDTGDYIMDMGGGDSMNLDE